MNEKLIKRGAEPRKILQTVCDGHIPAIMSYQSRGKWHVCKVSVFDVGASSFETEVAPRSKPHPMNVQIDQPVGFSIKYGYGKVIFESKVVGFKPPKQIGSGSRIVLAFPNRIELVERRSYFRVQVPKIMNVNVLLWHRRNNGDGTFEPDKYGQGQLVDISAGGAQVVVDSYYRDGYKKGQFIGLRFTPIPSERPLVLSAQIRNTLPTADEKYVCLGLQLVGLEATFKGREMLSRLCEVVEKYHNINRFGVEQLDMQKIKC